ncbi:MAG TPA: hypothetical protein ENI07_01925 [Desulfobacterales bacterium]|nr:hypothetical protein [Desulfobacterales bacterium]
MSFRTIGCQNFTKLSNKIEKWLDEEGLSEARIKAKITQGMDAKETKFFAHQGEVIETEEVEALGIQRQYVEMAVKVKGMFAPVGQLHDITPEAANFIMNIGKKGGK